MFHREIELCGFRSISAPSSLSLRQEKRCLSAAFLVCCLQVLINMTLVCPFVKATGPDDSCPNRSGENQRRNTVEDDSIARTESVNSASIEAECPFGYDSQLSENQSGHSAEHENKCITNSTNSAKNEPTYPVGYDSQSSENQSRHTAEHENISKTDSSNSTKIEPKCPFGYDSQSFKLGPLSCMICQAFYFGVVDACLASMYTAGRAYPALKTVDYVELISRRLRMMRIFGRLLIV